MRLWRCLVVFVCLALASSALPAGAQVSTGEIFGKVTDTTGAVMPGVTVTLSGPALIQPQTTLSVESGAYRFPRIPIGTYTVAFELAGFKKMIRDGIIIQAGFNAEIDAKLEISTLQETVTVSGESPVIDTRSTTLSASYSKEVLEKIPTARDPWVMIEQTPGMIMSGANVGGNLSGQQTSFSVFGSSNNQQWNLDGAVISDIASGNSSPTYYDFDSFDEIQVTTGGSDASQQGAGVQINFVTKSGGNTIRGSGRYFDTNERFESINIGSKERDLGASGGNPIQDIKDFGFEMGGPIVRNRFWYWGALSKNQTDVGVVNFYDTSLGSNCQTLASNTDLASSKDASGNYRYGVKDLWDCYKTDNTILKNYNGKLQFQESIANKSTFVVVDGIKTRNARGADAFTPLIATRRQDGPTVLYRGEHQWIASNRLTITGQYAHISEDWGLFFQNDGLNDVQPINNVDTGFIERNTTSGNYHTIRPQDDIKGDANYFLSSFLGGDHAIKFGFDYRRSPVESITTYGGGATIRARSASNRNTCTLAGVTYTQGCQEADIRRDGDSTYIQYNRSLYFNDSYKKGRATINGGLRFDRQFDHAIAAHVRANRIIPDLLPAIDFTSADTGVIYNNLSPRIGITYDLRGNGKTILKANTGRYWGLGSYTSGTLQPTGPTTLRYAWRDVNGDGNVQRAELDFVKGFLTTPTSNYNPANPNAAVTPASVDPDLKNDITDEVIVGADHELMRNFGIGFSYIYRNYHQFQNTYRSNPADVSSSYVPVTFTVACGNTFTCGTERFTGVYYQRSTPLNAATILRNNTQYNRYHGFEMSARKRLSNRWMMSGSVVFNHLRHYEPNANSDYLDPTNHAPIDRISGFENGTRNGPFVAKINALYQFPLGINAAANFNAYSNFPFNPYILSPNRSGSLGTVNVLLQDTNSIRFPAIKLLDLHVDKTVSFGRTRRVSLNADLFNVANSNFTRSQEERQNRSTANNILTLIAPRVARFGVKVNF